MAIKAQVILNEIIRLFKEQKDDCDFGLNVKIHLRDMGLVKDEEIWDCETMKNKWGDILNVGDMANYISIEGAHDFKGA